MWKIDLEKEMCTAGFKYSGMKMDMMDSPLYGVSENLLRKVQSVQNAAARLLTSTCRCDHITPLLRQLHWLPVQR